MSSNPSVGKSFMARVIKMINWSKTVLFSTLLLNSLVTVASDNTLTEQEKKAGWELLFDGQNMAQWRNYKQETIDKKWLVEDGMMVLTGKGAGDLISRKKYRNFDFKVDWNIALAGNSGVFIFVDEKLPIIYLHAPEIQLLDNKRHHDNQEDDHLSGSLYDMIASPKESHREAQEWNQLRIMVQDRHLTVWQNAVVTAQINIGSEQWKRLVASSKFKDWKGFGDNEKGYIGFQDHGDKVSFRNIKIRVID